MFYSKSTGGFYSENIHGSRRITITDPAWVRPIVTITLQPGERYLVGDQWVVNDGTHPLTLADVPDTAAVAPVIEIDNPDCKIPADADEITDAEHAVLLEGQSQGKRIIAGADGKPELADQPPPTRDQVIATMTSAVQAHLDSTANERGYDGIMSACTYATSGVPKFQAEGQACVQWRDAVWSACYAVLADVDAGKIAVPTIEALIAGLPAIVWPA